MKKIMFNDALGLTQAVLEGRKTQTRRIIPEREIEKYYEWRDDVLSIGFGDIPVHIQSLEEAMLHKAKFEVGEVVAIAQSYKATCDEFCNKHRYGAADVIFSKFHSLAGWTNKMFAKADEMPHRIKITNIRVERLQGISVDDCYAEDISYYGTRTDGLNFTYDNKTYFSKAKDAYQALINELDKKMWERNPWVFVYDFELVD